MSKSLSISSGLVATAVVVSGLLFSASSVFGAGPWFVSPTGNDANDCLGAGTPCLTIQGAINKASAGDTVNVAAGTYAEHVVVNKSLILKGANAGTLGSSTSRVAESIVDGSNTDAPFSITANDVTIDGFKIQNGYGGLNAGVAIGIDAASGYKLQNNLISANTIGVYANCASNCLIEHNLFDSNNTGPGASAGVGIYAEKTSTLTVNENEFRNHTINNPVIFATTATGAHQNLLFTKNYIHDNLSGVYVLSAHNAQFTGNNIRATDATDLSFSGDNVGVQVQNNILHDSARGVRIEDAGYGFGDNGSITVNRNDLSTDTEYGVGNPSGYTDDVDATCNWWGSASGPGPVGPGTGSPVTTGITYQSWLTTPDLANGPCNGPIPLATYTVTIVKFIDGAMATSGNAANLAFPMASSWTTTNIGNGSGTFTLDAGGGYTAVTSPMNQGASYNVNEDTTGNNVGASCSDGKPFALQGYAVGTSVNQASTSTPTGTSSSITNLSQDQFVIVFNRSCRTQLTLDKVVVNNNGGTQQESAWTLTATGSTTLSGPGAAGSTDVVSNASFQPGTYTLSESGPGGYTASAWSCVKNGGSAVAGNTITLATNDTAVCTITNDDNAVATSTVKVTIIKEIDGSHATTGNALGLSFPMVSSWNAVNLGGAGSGSYPLGPSGFNTANAYEAVTSDMTSGSSYTTNEDLTGANVAADCSTNRPFRLTGYKTGDSLSAAQAAAPTLTIPSFTNITTDKFVIVSNTSCGSNPNPGPPANACNFSTAPAGFILRNGTSGADSVTLQPNTMFVGKGGNDVIKAGNGNYIICTGNGNDSINIGDGDSTIDAGNGNNVIKTGNGNSTIFTGNGNDSVNTGDGSHNITTDGGNDVVQTGNGVDIIDVGNGNNSVKSGGANDTVTAGNGNDVINAGAGAADTCNEGGGINSLSGCEL